MRRRLHRNAEAALVVMLLMTCADGCRTRSSGAGPDADDAAPRARSSTGISSSSTVSGCPKFFEGRKLGNVDNADLTEASDLVVSQKNPGVIWSHNDSGRKARIFALSIQGHDLGTYHLDGVKVVDWEDMASGPGPEPAKDCLYVGDIGANKRARGFISVYRVEEPSVSVDQRAKNRKLSPVARFDFAFPDLTSHDAESLMIDPMTGDLYVVTKPRGGAAAIYRRRAPLQAGQRMSLELVSTFSPSGGGSVLPALVTSADISRDGSMILLRTYAHAFLWPRYPNEGVERALSRQPCSVPLRAERQGESIAFAPDGRGYYTVSEGRHSAIVFFERWQ